MSQRFTREEFYDLVWTKPLTHLAKDFRLSDVALHKICRKHDIPNPPLGWAIAVSAPVMPSSMSSLAATVPARPSPPRQCIKTLSAPRDPDTQATTKPQACCRHKSACSGSGVAEPALEPGLRARPDGIRQAVPGAQRGR